MISFELPAKVHDDICIGNDCAVFGDTVKVSGVWRNDIYVIKYHRSPDFSKMEISQPL